MTALTHDALIYGSDEEFTSSLVPFLRDGLEHDHSLVAVTTRENVELLRDALGADARHVTFVDAREWYVRPARTIAGYHRVLEEKVAAGTGLVRVVGEVEFGTTEHEHSNWTMYESILNRAFAGSPAWIVCPYDERSLDPKVVEDAARTHPFVFRDGRRQPSQTYIDPEEFVEQVRLPHTDEAAPVLVEMSVPERLADARRLVADRARTSGLTRERAEAFVLALNEIVTNAVRYGGGVSRLTVRSDGRTFVCEVTDRGPGIHDPFVGYIPPDPTKDGGFGLWIARQLCDTVDIRTDPDGATVRLSMTITSSS